MIKIIGAGMAGLLAGAILRDECSEIMEAQAKLPNNHTALLRFRSSIVGDAVNIPFTEVQVMKAVQSYSNPVADAISYSLKTNGSATLRSIISAEGKLEKRYIAPDDFVSRLAQKVVAPIRFDMKVKATSKNVPVISTMPMPALMKLLDYEVAMNHQQKFRSIAGCSLKAKLSGVDLCATIYIPDPEDMAYRASITKDYIIIEYAFPYCEAGSTVMEERIRYIEEHKSHVLMQALKLFGLTNKNLKQLDEPSVKKQSYAKILPIDENERKRFILWASEKHNIYSFGRFATWRPGLLMDDLVNDLRVIQRLINGGSAYDSKKGMTYGEFAQVVESAYCKTHPEDTA